MKIVYKQKPKRKGTSLWVHFLLLTTVAFVLSFTTNTPEKKYKVEMTLDGWIKSDKWVAIAKEALQRSDLPSKDVKMINDSLSAFQTELAKQINPQIEADKKLEKPKQDSSSKKQ